MGEVFSRRDVVAGTLASATLGGCAVSLGGRNGEVVACDGGGIWGRAQRLAFYKPFERETGIRVRTVPYVMPGKLRTSIEQRRPIIDMADLSASDVPVFERDGLLVPLERGAFDPQDLAALATGLRKATACAVPALYSSVIIAYRKDVFGDREPSGWADFWDVARRPGRRSLATGTLGVMSGTFEAALMADGVPMDRLYPIDWDRVFRSLDRLRPSVRKFWAQGGEPLQMLTDGNAAMSSIWNGRFDFGLAAQSGVGFTWNQGILGASYWVVPKGAVNREHAFRLMGFAMRPDRQAHFSRLIGYGPGNPRALDLLSPERRAVMPNAPGPASHQLVENADWWMREDRPGTTNIDLAVRLWENWVMKA